MAPREDPIHRSILQYLRIALPGALVVHAANEVALSGSEVARAISKAKSLGMVPGFPDLVVFPASSVGPLFFEVKAKGGTLSAAQRDVTATLDGLGYRVALVRSIEDVAARLADWGIPNRVPFRGVVR
jgi:hypothetical protein